MIWRLVSSVSRFDIEIGWNDRQALSTVATVAVPQAVRRQLVSSTAGSVSFGGILVALLLDARTLLLNSLVVMQFEPSYRCGNAGKDSAKLEAEGFHDPPILA
jgi:hypothetical protein